MESTKPKTYTAAVSSATNVAGEFYVAKFALTNPSTIAFTAGQYVIFQIGPPKLRHTLSIASSPRTSGTIDILQSVAPMGEGSKWLLGLKAGDTVQFLGPLGKFTLQKESPLRLSEVSPRQKVFVATGCGLAPLRSMILDYLETGGEGQVLLYWGLRYETDLFWQEELEDLAKRYPNFHPVTTLSKPGDAWTGEKGRVTDQVVGKTSELQSSEYYLCGIRQMIVDMRRLLTENGVPPEHIFTEAFF